MPRLHFTLDDLVTYFAQTPQREIFDNAYIYTHSYGVVRRILPAPRRHTYKVSDGIVSCLPKRRIVVYGEYLMDDVSEDTQVRNKDHWFVQSISTGDSFPDQTALAHFADSRKFQKEKEDIMKLSSSPRITKIKLDELEYLGRIIRSIDVALMMYEGNMGISNELKSALHADSKRESLTRTYEQIMGFFGRHLEKNVPIPVSEHLRKQIERMYCRFKELDSFYQREGRNLPIKKGGDYPREFDFSREQIFDMFGLERRYSGDKVYTDYNFADFSMGMSYEKAKKEELMTKEGEIIN